MVSHCDVYSFIKIFMVATSKEVEVCDVLRDMF